jgi:hypothetical protein
MFKLGLIYLENEKPTKKQNKNGKRERSCR